MKGPLILGMVIFLSCGFLPCSFEESTTPKPEDTTPDNDPICYEDGECLNSNLIDVTYPNTTAKCLEDCKNTAGCQWVTYKRHKYDPPQPTFCQLFENCGYFNEECRENCTTSHVSCPVQQCNILGRCEVLYTFLVQKTTKIYTYIYFRDCFYNRWGHTVPEDVLDIAQSIIVHGFHTLLLPIVAFFSRLVQPLKKIIKKMNIMPIIRLKPAATRCKLLNYSDYLLSKNKNFLCKWYVMNLEGNKNEITITIFINWKLEKNILENSRNLCIISCCANSILRSMTNLSWSHKTRNFKKLNVSMKQVY